MRAALEPASSPTGHHMTTAKKRHPNEEQAQARREQVLAAARLCFARKGFQGASMAEISKTAGMSPGHIYNYFESKKDIVAGIVAQDLGRRMEMMEQIRRNTDVMRALVDFAHLGVDANLDPQEAALNLEIMAEAARNPEIGALVIENNSIALAYFTGLIRGALNGREVSDADLAGRSEAIGALFEGLNQRIVSNPRLEKQATLDAVRIALEAILSAP
jgi:TetR/AcrR family transcriptional regulator, repressor for uid operon